MLGTRWWCNPSCIEMCLASLQAITWNTIWIKQKDKISTSSMSKSLPWKEFFKSFVFHYLKWHLRVDERLKSTRLLTESVLMKPNTYSSIPCQYQSPHFWTAASDPHSQSLHLQVAQMFSSTRWNDCYIIKQATGNLLHYGFSVLKMASFKVFTEHTQTPLVNCFMLIFIHC